MTMVMAKILKKAVSKFNFKTSQLFYFAYNYTTFSYLSFSLVADLNITITVLNVTKQLTNANVACARMQTVLPLGLE